MNFLQQTVFFSSLYIVLCKGTGELAASSLMRNKLLITPIIFFLFPVVKLVLFSDLYIKTVLENSFDFKTMFRILQRKVTCDFLPSYINKYIFYRTHHFYLFMRASLWLCLFFRLSCAIITELGRKEWWPFSRFYASVKLFHSLLMLLRDFGRSL